MRTFVLIGLSLALAPVLRAQQPAKSPVPALAQSPAPASAPQPTPRPVLPPGPPLAKAPDFAQWTIVSKTAPPPDATPTPSPSASTADASAGGRKKEAAHPSDLTITVVKTKPIRFEQIVTVSGSKSQKWIVPDMQVTIRGSGRPQVSLPGATRDSYYADYSKADFGGFEWISARNYEGVAKVMGQDCFVFRDKMKNEDALPMAVLACIDADSRLPVMLQLGEEMRTYQFGPAPTAMLTVPPDIEALMNQWRKTLRQAALPPAKP